MLVLDESNDWILAIPFFKLTLAFQVNVGIVGMSRRGDRLVSKVGLLAVPVAPNITRAGLLEAAVWQHQHFSPPEHTQGDFLLLYLSYTVVDNLPGSAETFSLPRYKDLVGKGWSKLRLYLCQVQDYKGTKLWILFDVRDLACWFKSFCTRQTRNNCICWTRFSLSIWLHDWKSYFPNAIL